MFACPTCATPVGASEPVVPGLRVGPRHRGQPDRHGPPPRGPSLADAFAGPGADPLERARPPPAGERFVPGHGPGRPLPHHRAPRPRGDGRGLPGRRPEARAAGRPQVPAARPRRGRASGSPASTARSGWPGRSRTPRSAACTTWGRRRATSSCPWSWWTARTSPRSCGASAGCLPTRRSTSRASSAPGSPPRTRRASCTGTSSPRTSCSTARATCASPTSASPASPSRSARRTCARGRPATCRPSSCRAARSASAATSTRSASCCTSSTPGRRAFQGKSLAEFVRKHRDERPIEPSALVAGLDPAVERAILACLEKEPRRRPSSALVVSAMLTGSDPLEAAIAAGETPSPELVAAAGEAEGLRPGGRLGPARRRAGRPRRSCPSPAASFRLLERRPGREAAGRARGPGARPRPARGRGRARDRRRVGPRRGLELPGRGAREGHVALALGRARLGEPSGPAVLVPRRAPGRSCRSCRAGRSTGSKPGLDVDRHGGRHLRHGGAPPALLPRARRSSRATPRRRPPPPRTGRRCFAEARLDPGALRAVEPKWDAALLHRRARGVGGDLAGSPRRAHPGRGRRPPRQARVVRGHVAVDAARADGEVRLAGGEAPQAGAVDHALAAPPRRGRLHGPPQHRARAGGPARGLPGRAAARGGRHPLLGPRRPPRGRLERRDRASSAAGRAWSCSRRRSCGSSTSRSSRTRGGCAPGPSCRGRASSAAGSATRWSAATRSSASPGPCSCSPSCRCPTSSRRSSASPRPT